MVNYNNGKIYKIEPICDHEEGEVYIGSTTKKYLSQRMDNHRRSYKAWKSGKANKVMVYDIFDKYGFDNCHILLIENINCESKDELQGKEGYYIRLINCINKTIIGRTKEEYNKDNKYIIKQKKKEYAEKNKEILKEKSKEYNEKNKEKIKELRKAHYVENKIDILCHNQDYYNQNKVEICKKRNSKIECCCGSLYRKGDKARHEKSFKHLNYLQSLN